MITPSKGQIYKELKDLERRITALEGNDPAVVVDTPPRVETKQVEPDSPSNATLVSVEKNPSMLEVEENVVIDEFKCDVCEKPNKSKAGLAAHKRFTHDKKRS